MCRLLSDRNSQSRPLYYMRASTVQRKGEKEGGDGGVAERQI